jgi:phosphate-selective porin OprO/OprP
MALMAATVLSAEQGGGESKTPENRPCDSPPRLDAMQQTTDQASPEGAVCDEPSGNIRDEAQQEITTEIAEGTQTALSLESLLLGRKYVFFGRIEGEAAAYSGDIPSSENGAELRRLRVGIAGLSTFQWELPKQGSLRVGNQRVSQNLSAMTSSLSQLFMEDPLPVSAFSLSRRFAVSYDENWRRFGLHGMAFTRDPNNDAGKYGWAIRAYTEPIRGFEQIGHIGFSWVSEKMDREARYRTRPESNITEIRLVDTGMYADVQYQHVFGAEIAGGLGANSMKLELFRARWERDGGVQNHFKGAYLELGRFLTGQNFNYKGGRFLRPVLEPGSKAWEIGFRASWVDLTDKDVRGGEQLNLGAALNYYVRPDLRFQFNLLHFRTDTIAGDDTGWILQGRLQYNR